MCWYSDVEVKEIIVNFIVKKIFSGLNDKIIKIILWFVSIVFFEFILV